MTVSYTPDVANASSFGCFTKILFRWKGSVYKLILKEISAYIFLYFIVNTIYRTVLCQPGNEYYRHFFEGLKKYCSIHISSIPMTFGLGFYVSLIVKRWWDQYSLLPWPDSLAIFVVGLIGGLDERPRMMRRNIMRYILLAYVITLRRVSLRVHKRFPTLEHVVDAGLMRPDELKIFEVLDEKCSFSKWWMPLVWATNIVAQARQETLIKSDPAVQTILGEISNIRRGLTGVQHYDTISVPLVYTQVVTLAIYSYFGAALIGAQWVTPADPEDYNNIYNVPAFPMHYVKNGTDPFGSDSAYQALDLYVPLFLILKFMFYVGWLKVAETLINPFGEDDDDFELNYLIDRHVQVSYMIVDDMHHEHPELLKDIYFNDPVPPTLPYTKETEHCRKEEPKGSAEVIVETDSNSMTYYKLDFMNRNASKRNSRKPVDDHLSSEYESIDTRLFGNWFRSKRGRSTIRHSGRSNSSTSVINGPTSRRRRPSVDGSKSIKSFNKSNRSIYAKMFGPRFNSKRGPNLVEHAESPSKLEAGIEYEDEVTKRKKSAVSTISSQALYGKLESLKIEEEDEEDDTLSEEPEPTGRGITMERLRQLRQLSTVSEENTPCSTNPTSRRNSNLPECQSSASLADSPVMDNKFKSQLMPIEGGRSENGSHCYYPLGSEGSHRPTSPRSHLDDVPNYEPIIFSAGSRSFTPTSSPKPPHLPAPNGSPRQSPDQNRLLTRQVSPKPISPLVATSKNCSIPASPVAATPVILDAIARRSLSTSPALPKRKAVMSLKQVTKEKTPENSPAQTPSKGNMPKIIVTRDSEGRDSPDCLDHENETTSESISTDKEEDDDASSAFDSATFYV
eukprot:snap_masked-scaffold110_size354795-processed-gene-2.3 protein:Tk03438 transcript:snap_masked-scaffold110_size354795-processed-gene-2.3-mRNA-1 annotation:"bestrophin 23"